MVLKINYFKLRDDLTNTFYSENFLELKELVTNNKWADALVDINIQYVVLLVAFIFAILESVVGIITILRNYKVDDIIKKWSEDTKALLYLVISVIFILGGVIVFLTGGLVSPEQIELFKLNSASPLFTFLGTHPPPFSSHIFIARVVIVIYAGYLTYFLKNTLPQVLNEQNI